MVLHHQHFGVQVLFHAYKQLAALFGLLLCQDLELLRAHVLLIILQCHSQQHDKAEEARRDTL